jgi:hypothetical protein
MLLDRMRNTGIALLAAALCITAWKRSPWSRGGEDEGPQSAGWTVPIEIVETGRAPVVKEVRVRR